MVWWDELSPAERAAADDCLGLIANPRLREGVERYVAALNAMRNLMGWGSTDKPTVSDAVAALNAVMIQARHEERGEAVEAAKDAKDAKSRGSKDKKDQPAANDPMNPRAQDFI